MNMISTESVAVKLGVARSSVWNLLKRDASFPRPVKLSARTVRWVENEIDAWLEGKKERCAYEAE